MPVAFQLQNRFLLFQDTGVCIINGHGSMAQFIPSGTWALTDFSQSVNQPCDAFVDAVVPKMAWIIQTASRARDKWTDRIKLCDAVYWMDVFNLGELIALGYVQHDSRCFYLHAESLCSKILHLDANSLRKYYDLWGPSARLCISLTRNPNYVAGYEDRVVMGADLLTKDHDQFNTSNQDSPIHRLFFVVRPAPDRRTSYEDFAINRICEIVLCAYARQNEAVRASFYEAIRGTPWFGPPAGKMYKVHVFLWFQYSQSSLQCTGAESTFPELSVPACPGEGNFRFYSKPKDLADILADIEECQTGKPICVVPTSETFPFFDAFIITGVAVITIQVTIYDKHDAKEGGFEILNSLPFLAKRPNRYHVFITDKEINAAKLRKQKLPQIPNGTLVYSAVVPVEKLESEAPVTEERVLALGRLRVSIYWLYAI
jgi:hypothetical protein